MTRPLFPLFQSHIDLAHAYWERIVLPGDSVIDATCGNGHDTLLLAKIALQEGALGKVIAIDTQQKAIETTKERLFNHLTEQQFKSVDFRHQSHESFPSEIRPGTIKLITYNLGYLPNGDKTITTKTSTTIQSIENALNLICEGGAISITCYPGHPEGLLEEQALFHFVTNLQPQEWSCCHHRWLNRSKSPSLLLLQKLRTTFAS